MPFSVGEEFIALIDAGGNQNPKEFENYFSRAVLSDRVAPFSQGRLAVSADTSGCQSSEVLLALNG